MPHWKVSDCDVIVVGAGVAGLAAARELNSSGLHAICVEARDRIGGRIFSLHDPLSPVAIETGAEFVHGRPPEIWNIATEAGLAIHKVRGDRVYSQNGVIHKNDDHDGDGVEAVFADLERQAQCADETFLDFLNQSSYPDDVKQSVTGYVEGFNASRKEIIGIASLAEDKRAADEIDGGHSFRLAEGYDAVPLTLSRGVNVRLNSPVVRVEWKCGAVSIHTPDAILRARAAILTLPLGVLQAGSVQFDPEPRATFQAARALAVGHVIRVTLRFEAPFWENNSDLKDTVFIFSSHPLFPTWWTTLPIRAPVITGWSAGPRADQILAIPKSQIIDEAVTALGRVAGIEPPPVEKAYFHDWQADPFSLGAYSYVPAGALPQRAILAEPVEDTLFFAGEATDLGGHSATVHGAIASGRRAARKIVQNFRLAGRPR